MQKYKAKHSSWNQHELLFKVILIEERVTHVNPSSSSPCFLILFNYSIGNFQEQPITDRLSIRPEDSKYWINTKPRRLNSREEVIEIFEGKMFTLNHNFLFPKRMFSSQFSIVRGNKINQSLFVCWLGGEEGVFSCSSERLLSVSIG